MVNKAYCGCAVFVHVLGSFQLYTMPVYDLLEIAMRQHNFSNGLWARLVYRSIYVVLVTFVAVRSAVELSNSYLRLK